MSDYKLADCDLAYKITYAKKGDLNCISSNEELMNIVGTIAKYERENLSDIFDAAEILDPDRPPVPAL